MRGLRRSLEAYNPSLVGSYIFLGVSISSSIVKYLSVLLTVLYIKVLPEHIVRIECNFGFEFSPCSALSVSPKVSLHVL